MDDTCNPIPEEIFILVGLGEKDLFDYCRMRIFNTLFRWKEVDDSIKEVLWPKFLRTEQYKNEYYRAFYKRLYSFPDPDLDQEIREDETRTRFKVRTRVPG